MKKRGDLLFFGSKEKQKKEEKKRKKKNLQYQGKKEKTMFFLFVFFRLDQQYLLAFHRLEFDRTSQSHEVDPQFRLL